MEIPPPDAEAPAAPPEAAPDAARSPLVDVSPDAGAPAPDVGPTPDARADGPSPSPDVAPRYDAVTPPDLRAPDLRAPAPDAGLGAPIYPPCPEYGAYVPRYKAACPFANAQGQTIPGWFKGSACMDCRYPLPGDGAVWTGRVAGCTLQAPAGAPYYTVCISDCSACKP